MEQISIRLPSDLLESLDEEAEDSGKSRAEYIRQVLKDRNDTDEHERITKLENRIQELESELREVRTERDELLGELKAKQEELDDLREWRNSAVGTLARTPAIEDDETLVEAVEAETEESGGSWWRFWR